MFRKPVLVLISFVIIASLAGGCWSRREVEDLAIAMVLGIDKVTVKGQDKYRFSARVIRPSQIGKGTEGVAGAGKPAPSVVISSVGETLYDAERNFSTRSPRRMFMAHSKVIVLGERVAGEGVHEVMDFLLRHKDVRMRNWVVVAKGEALDLLETEPEMETLLSSELSELIQVTRNRISKAAPLDLREFAQALLNPGMDPVTAWFDIMIPPEQRPGQAASMGAPARGGSQAPAMKTVSLHGGAVFRRDRLVGFLGDNQTKGYLYARGKDQAGIIPVRMPGHREKDISFVMTRASSKIRPVIKGGKIAFAIQIDAEGDLGEHEETHSIATEKDLQRIEKAVQSVIKLYIRSALHQAQQEYQADIFGFGDLLHKKEPKVWKQVEKNWYDLYPDVPVSISVEVKIRRTGMISEPLVIK